MVVSFSHQTMITTESQPTCIVTVPRYRNNIV